MRVIQLEIYFKSKGAFSLPIHYNYLVQGAIYNSIDEELANFLHDVGYENGKRSFKMFTFSLLQGPYQLNKDNKTINFDGSVKLTISSPMDEFCQSLVNILLSRGSMRIGSKELEIEKIFATKQLVEKEELVVRTISPVVLYSTMLRPDGRKYTVYFQPGDPDYNRLLNQNLHKKFEAFYALEPPKEEVGGKGLGVQRMRIVDYKGTIIKGYSGKLLLKGPIPLLQMAVDSGLGGKNSQGFGCLEMIE